MCGFFVFSAKKIRFFSAIILCAALFGTIVGSVTVLSGEAKNEGVRLPVIMYHSVLKNASRTGKYVVTPESVKSDLTYLKNHGYTAVVPSDLVKFSSGEGDLPEKPVMITFDDGFYNNIYYVLPILEELDMKALISPVGSYGEKDSESGDKNPNYSYITWEDMKKAADSGRIEIGNHTYDMHCIGDRRGCKKRFCESEEEYKGILRADVGKMQEKLNEIGIDCICFTYPFGAVSEEAKSVLKDLGFSVTLGCEERVNYISDRESLWDLGRFNREGDISTEKFMKRIE